MSDETSGRAHLVCGGFPAGSSAGHDIDYARLRLLGMLRDASVRTTVAGDFSDLEKWLPKSRLLVSYVAGPFPNPDQCVALEAWLAAGGHWLALHGTSGGKAERIADSYQRRMVKLDHHRVLGSFFLNHPPVRRFAVHTAEHPLTEGVPRDFEVADELYLLEMQGDDIQPLITTELASDPSPEGFGFLYEEDESLRPDAATRVLGYHRSVGDGGVTYYGLGHCHSPRTNIQPFVDLSVAEDAVTPLEFVGPWETVGFERLLTNAIAWGASG